MRSSRSNWATALISFMVHLLHFEWCLYTWLAKTPKSLENREKETPSSNENKAIAEEIHLRAKAIAESLFKGK